MAIEEGVAEIVWTATHVALLVLILVLLHRHRIDVLRHRLFVLRDELFDYALENDISFQAPAYVRLRRRINSMLRFAHRINLTRFLLLLVAGTKLHRTGMLEEYDHQWRDALAQLGCEEHRNRIADIRERALFEASKHMAFGLVPWIFVLSKVAFLRRLWQRCRLSLLRTASIVEVESLTLWQARVSTQAACAAVRPDQTRG